MTQPAAVQETAPAPAATRLALPLLIMAYPVLSHLAAVMALPLLQWLALVVLCVIPQYAALRAGRARHWLLLAVLAAGLYALTAIGGGAYALMLPPVLLPAMVALFFTRSLRQGNVPLISRMAAAERGVLTPELQSYTRNVTLLWAVMLWSLSATAVVLAFTAPPWLWSLFTNCLCYVVMGAAFVGEYVWRRLRFRHLPHTSFAGFVRNLVHTRYSAI